MRGIVFALLCIDCTSRVQSQEANVGISSSHSSAERASRLRPNSNLYPLRALATFMLASDTISGTRGRGLHRFATSGHTALRQVGRSQGISMLSEADSAFLEAEIAQKAAQQAREALLEAENEKAALDDATERARAGVQMQMPTEVAEVAEASPAPGATWKAGSFHRFVKEDFNAAIFKTRERFLGARNQGTFDGSFQVRFTMPDSGDSRMIELLPTTKGNAKFGAIVVKVPSFAVVGPVESLPIKGDAVGSLGALGVEEAEVPDSIREELNEAFQKNGGLSPFTHMVVSKVNNADFIEESFRSIDLELPDLKKGDIIRAISLPKAESSGNKPWWQDPGAAVYKAVVGELPEGEEGMYICDNESADSFYKAIGSNTQVGVSQDGEENRMVLIIERPEQ